MWYTSLLMNLRRRPGHRALALRKRSASCRLTVEALEGRDVPSYAITDLGVLPGFASSAAVALNNTGEVVGNEQTADSVSHAFLWQNGVMTDLGTLGGDNSYAYAINDAGQVVGISDSAATDQYGTHFQHAFLWQNGAMTDLGTLGGTTSRAFGINSSGQIVGDSTTTDDNAQHAFLWQNGAMTDLGTLPGTSTSSATAINDSGQVIGTADYGIPFLWQDGTMTALDLDGYDSGFPNSINNAGQVVGSVSGWWTYSTATLWQDGQLSYLGSLDGGESYATSINNPGQVVGWSDDPFLWQNGVMTDLTTQFSAGNASVYVQSINDAGQIAGSADDHAILLDPVASLPSLTISNISMTEGNSDTTTAVFTVTLSAASSFPVTVQDATADDTATAGSDYQAASDTLTFAPGQTSKTISISVIGDRIAEANETFYVNLSEPTNATIANGQGVCTILDDEPRISVSDVSKAEGSKGQTTLFTFTVTLSSAYDQPVTMSFHTVNGTATTGDHDYVAQTGTLTFSPGQTTKTITIVVNGDNKKESNETFFVDLFGNSSDSLFTKNRGIGTILNDD
jgi:probable HAF family extracellular repeat protein